MLVAFTRLRKRNRNDSKRHIVFVGFGCIVSFLFALTLIQSKLRSFLSCQSERKGKGKKRKRSQVKPSQIKLNSFHLLFIYSLCTLLITLFQVQSLQYDTCLTCLFLSNSFQLFSCNCSIRVIPFHSIPFVYTVFSLLLRDSFELHFGELLSIIFN